MGDQYLYYGSGNKSRSVVRDDDLEEEDVWAAVAKEKKDKSPKMRKSKESPVSPVPRHLSSASRMIPRFQNSSSLNDGIVGGFQQSAPVSIPDWSKIYGKNGSDNYGVGSWRGRGQDYADDEDAGGGFDDDDDGEEDGKKIPPHEWIAKKLARSQISSFSVCEGAGRTLKGRDLSKVRNAVLTRTGFLE